MKLHLPKALFTAVMALFAVSQTVWAGWSVDSRTSNHAYYYDQDNGNNGTIDTLTLPADGNGIEVDDEYGLFTAEDKWTKLYLVSGYGGDNKPEGYDGQTTTIGKVVAANDITFTIAENPWQTWKGYKELTIEEFEFGGGTGSGVININNGTGNDSTDNVQINKVSGTLSGLSVAAGASLKLGDGTTAETFTLGGSTSISTQGTVTVAQKSTIRFTTTDAIAHGTNNCGMTLDGSTWEANGTRQSLGGNYTLTLKSGVVKDSSTAGFGDGYGVLDATGAATIVSSGTSSISGGFRIRGGNVTVNVTDGVLSVDTFNHKGNGGIIKQGEGTLKITTMATNRQNEGFYGGNTTLQAGTIEYAIDKISNESTLDGSYTGTISGTGNIAKSGTGTVTLANINGLDGDITVSGGTLNVTALTTNKTIDVSVAGGTLNITSVTLDSNTLALTEKSGSSGTQYYSIDGGTTQNNVGNGFLYTSGDYVLFTNYVWEGDVGEGMTITNDGTNTYVSTAGTPGTTFYVSDGALQINAATIGAESYAVKGGTMEIVGTMNASDIQYTSGNVKLLNADSTLVLDSTDNAGTLLALATTTEGAAGTIKVTANTTMTGAAQAKGKLVVEGATLTVELPRVNTNDGPNKNENTWLSSFNSIELNNAVVKYHGSTTTWKNVTVGEDGATIKIRDMDSGGTNPNLNKFLTLDGTTTLDGALTIESTWDGSQTWKYGVNIKALTGTGDLTIKGTQSTNSTGEYNYVTAKLKDTYTGSITVNHGTGALTKLTLSADGDINLEGLTLTGGNKAQVDLSGVLGTKNLGTVSVGEGSTLNLQGVIGDMTATGDGGISMADGTSITGEVSIANALTIAGTISNTGKVTLSSNVTIDEIVSLKSSGTVTYSDNGGTDGYLSAAEYFVVESTGSGTATVTNGMKLNNLYDISVKDNSLVININNDAPSGAYYVNNTVNYGGDGSSTQIMADTTTGITMNGGTLNLNTALAEGVAISTVKSGSTINLAAGVTLDNSAVTPGDVKSTLTGVAATDSTKASVYSMGVASMNGGANSANNETKLNVAIGEGWQGTVVFEEGSSFKDYSFDLNDYGVAGSTIQFNGTATGSYLGDVTNTYVADIELKGNGFSIENGFGGLTYTFTGAFKGDGTFNMNKAGLNGGLKFNFSGDMSKWTGELKQSDAANDSYSYTFNEKATNIANKVTAAAGTMVVNVDNSEAVTMAGDVTATGGTMKLSKTGASNLTVDKLSANGGNVVLAGTGDDAIEVGNMSIKAGNTVTGAADVTVTDTLAVAAENALALTGALTLSDGVTINLTGLDIVDGKTSYTLATADNGVTLQNYTITGLDLTGTMYEGYRMTISPMDSNAAAGISLLAGEGNTNTNALVLTLEQNTNPLTEVMVTNGSWDAASKVLTLTTDKTAAELAAGFGEKLNAVIGDALWEQLTENVGTLVDVSFTTADGNTVFDFNGVDNNGTAPTVTLNGIGAHNGQNLAGNGTIVGSYVTAYIPEPTSTTLSLLALAALAVRRRRK